MGLQKISEETSYAECARCHRRSPAVQESDAARVLARMGWASAREDAWVCPICEGGRAGQYRTTER